MLFSLTILLGCKAIELPRQRYSQYEFEKSYTFEGNTLKIVVKNLLQ